MQEAADSMLAEAAAQAEQAEKMAPVLAAAEAGDAAAMAAALDAAGASEKSSGETREIYEEFGAKRAATQVCGIHPQLYYR